VLQIAAAAGDGDDAGGFALTIGLMHTIGYRPYASLIPSSLMLAP
jgi:hypothetical protein